MEKKPIKGMILQNDPGRKRKMRKQQVNFSIDIELHLDVKDLHIMEERKRANLAAKTGGMSASRLDNSSED